MQLQLLMINNNMIQYIFSKQQVTKIVIKHPKVYNDTKYINGPYLIKVYKMVKYVKYFNVMKCYNHTKTYM